MPLEAPRPELSAEELRALRELLERASGFVLREELKFLAERRLAPRLEALGLQEFSAYLRHLRFDPRGPEEIEAALDVLVPRETYFFREREQLESFMTEVAPQIAQENAASRSLKIWSAGCSTGEEAYTLAMLVDSCGFFTDWNVEILGTDMSRKALNIARTGEYPDSAMRTATPQDRQRFFSALPGDRFAVRERYRNLVRWGRVNLIEKSATVPTMDVIFCRNVLIYFERATRRQVVDHFFDQLRPGGWLFLGHSENLLNEPTRFSVESLPADLAYRKPLHVVKESP